MTTQEIFLRLPNDIKDKFAADIINFGLIHDLNPNAWNQTLKWHIKRSKGGLKKLYKHMQALTTAERERFFNAFLTKE
jgi:hypothetical protein